jgi:heterodisulfide reductase subunit B
MRQHPRLEQAVNEALEAGDLHYKPGSVRVRHLVEVIINDIGFERLGQLVRRPLYCLKLAAYYVCLIVRPDNVLDDVEQPMLLDRMIEALGAEAAPFSMKTACCGGHMTQISETTALEMIHRLVTNASVNEADAMVTICPMCQLNLDVYQDAANRMFETSYTMPVRSSPRSSAWRWVYPGGAGFGQEFVSVEPLIEKIRDVLPARSKPERRPKQALPMPAMPQ